MKKTPIFYGNQYVTKFVCSGERLTPFQKKVSEAKRMAKICLSIASVIVLAAWCVTAGVMLAKANLKTEKVYAKEIVEVPVTVVPPVMKRIAKCESGGSHKKNGQVVINHTQDAGLYQVNLPVWSKTATKMGLDLMIEADNEKFAMYLYENYGTEPWSASRHCWNK